MAASGHRCPQSPHLARDAGTQTSAEMHGCPLGPQCPQLGTMPAKVTGGRRRLRPADAGNIGAASRSACRASSSTARTSWAISGAWLARLPATLSVAIRCSSSHARSSLRRLIGRGIGRDRKAGPPVLPARPDRQHGAGRPRVAEDHRAIGQAHVALGAFRVGGRVGLLEPVFGGKVGPRPRLGEKALGDKAAGRDAQALGDGQAGLVRAGLAARDDLRDHGRAVAPLTHRHALHLVAADARRRSGSVPRPAGRGDPRATRWASGHFLRG